MSTKSHYFAIEKPILRWAGGKSWLLNKLESLLPSVFNDYHEPFLGGASIFFSLKPSGRSFLSDSNLELINAFTEIKNNVEDLISLLKQFSNTKEDYYWVRSRKYQTPTEQAAQFIYLNRTCFNGIYRVNLRGEFNVPFGYKTYKSLFEYDRFRRASEILQSAHLYVDDFWASLDNVGEGDFVFLDPPYTVSHVKNGFIKYNEKLFSWRDQKRLAEYISELKLKRANYILTNAKHSDVEDLFGKLDRPISISRASVIGGKKAKRGTIEEYIFTNIR